MQQTLDEDINRLLDSILSQMRAILPQKLAGLYLHGSLTTGDFDRETSDIDLLAATASDLDETERAALREMHQNIARDNREWEGRIEAAYLSEAALKTFRTHRSPMAIISPGEPFHTIEAGRDWLANWFVVREKGLALFGPPPQAMIAPITKAEFVQSIREYVASSEAWTSDKQERCAQSYAILTLCRALYLHVNGEQASKKQAAIWAQAALPEWADLIRNAVVWRTEFRDQHVDHAATVPQTVRFVHFVREQMQVGIA